MKRRGIGWNGVGQAVIFSHTIGVVPTPGELPMRARRAPQRSLFDAGYPDHDMGRVLALMSRLLDEHPEFLEWIAADVDRGGASSVGRCGLPCEVILRCGILKHLWQSDYRELEFVLVDSVSARRFTRVDPLRSPKRSALQRCIGAVRAEVWERINRVLLGRARDDKIEAGRKVRIDSTVTETHILDPSDSQLLYDAVRVLSRLLARGREKLGPDAFPFHDHRRAAKRKKWKIPKARMKRKVKLYRELLAVVRRTLRYTDGALAAVEGREEPWLDAWRTQVAHYRDLAGAVVRQTVRRVLRGEKVPAEEKVVSLFEPHTDIIRKGGRRVQYGHKVNLGSGASGLVFDAVVEAGNPADSSRCLPMIERHAAIYGSVPEQVACDGGYASKANLAEAKALGVRDMVFHKKRGLKATDMASSPRVYGRLRNFRAGMEAVVSYLKRCFGLGRCNWRGLEHFRAYVWSAVVTHNLWMIARRKLKLKPV